MTFAEAYEQMKLGKKIKMPDWGGYWYWSKQHQTIFISTRLGEHLDIRDTKDVDFTFSFITKNTWIAY